MKTNKKKTFPRLTTDKKAEDLVEKADLSDYDFSKFKMTHFEFQSKSRPISLRLPESLYKVIQRRAKKEGVKTQRFIRKALERAVS